MTTAILIRAMGCAAVVAAFWASGVPMHPAIAAIKQSGNAAKQNPKPLAACPKASFGQPPADCTCPSTGVNASAPQSTCNPTPAPTPAPTPPPVVQIQTGEPVFSLKASSLSAITIGPGQTITTQVFCYDPVCVPSNSIYWDINNVGTDIAGAALEYSFINSASDPDFLQISTSSIPISVSSLVVLGYQVVDANGTSLVVGSRTVAVNIVANPVIVPVPAPTIPPNNLNAAVMTAIASSKCKDGSGALGNGCAIAANKIFDKVLGHTVPRYEGWQKNQAPTPGGEICYNKSVSQTSHPCMIEWVPDVVELLIRDRYAVQILPPNQPLPGDIAVQDGNDPVGGMNHIGFCTDNGCSSTISNAGHIGQLCGVSNAQYTSDGYTYPAATPTFYRLVRK